MKKIISIDLDGVLNTYSGDYNENNISPLREGAKEFLEKLSNDYRIEIFTVRDKNLVKSWINENKLNDYIYDVTDKKNPYTSIFIDDRAINFDGDYKNMLRQIQEFKPHWK